MSLLNFELSQFQVFRRMPLRLVLVVPFVLQVFAAVGLTGWFSLRNGQKAVNSLAIQLHSTISSQVIHHLENQLNLPHQINQLNVDAINIGVLKLPDFEHMGQTFYRQMQMFDVGYINFANPQGEFIGVERLEDGKLLINERSRRLSGKQLHVYTANQQGKRIQHLAAKPYNPLIEAWYADAVNVGKPLWSAIYQWDDKPEILSISSSYPVYSSQKQLLGVLGVDLQLSEFSHFLKNLQTSASAQVFVVERNGLLVGSSAAEPPFILKAGKAQRIKADRSSNFLIRSTANYLTHHFNDLTQIQTTQQLTFRPNGQTQFVQVTPWQDHDGLNWLIIVVVPESNFMGQIYANTQATILVCLLALTSAILFGLVTSRWITRRIQRVAEASQIIAAGNLDQPIEVNGIYELEVLAESFNQMAVQLKVAFTELEERVAQRTSELVEAKDAAEEANRIKSEFLASMSHELRTPLNAILGFAQVAQHDTSLTPEHQKHLSIIFRNANHLLSLINDLIEVARTGVSQEVSEVDLPDLKWGLQSKPANCVGGEVFDPVLIAYLSQMPADWVAQLYQSAIKGFDQDILQLLMQIPADLAPLTASLRAWVEDFQFEKVLALVQQVQDSHR